MVGNVNKEIVMEQELKSLMDKHPLLDNLGVAGKGSREELLLSTETLRVAVEWFRNHPSRAGNSYTLKHKAEKDIDYVANGVFIAAAMLAGRKCRFGTAGSPNAEISRA